MASQNRVPAGLEMAKAGLKPEGRALVDAWLECFDDCQKISIEYDYEKIIVILHNEGERYRYDLRIVEL